MYIDPVRTEFYPVLTIERADVFRNDGSQYPRGFLKETYVIKDEERITRTFTSLMAVLLTFGLFAYLTFKSYGGSWFLFGLSGLFFLSSAYSLYMMYNWIKYEPKFFVCVKVGSLYSPILGTKDKKWAESAAEKLRNLADESKGSWLFNGQSKSIEQKAGTN